MFGKSLPRTTLSGRSASRGNRSGGKRGAGLEEIGEHHGGVQVQPGVLLGQVQELGIFRGAQMRDDGGQLGMPAHYALELVRSGETCPWNRSAAHMHHNGNRRVRQQAPHFVEQGVAQVKSAHLSVDLEHPCTALEG